MFNREFWRDAAERAIKSCAQGIIFVLVQDLQPSATLNLFDADVATTIGVGLGMALLSLLSSIASAGVSGTISPASLAHSTNE